MEEHYKELVKFGRGRPPMFATPEEMATAFEAYFESTPSQKWTWTGLALSVGTTRQGLDNYLSKEGFGDIIIRAKAVIEMSYEELMKETGKHGYQFVLKNFGWKDKQEVESTNKITIQGILDGLEDPDYPAIDEEKASTLPVQDQGQGNGGSVRDSHQQDPVVSRE